ncbi:unnamed protein product [Onchocerca flexuosa]|uniref:J domain-containing protein n=1 Tax=Onchocerca flexuosa TaxID=387005 RepID=A0A183HBL8_9BILA|nr:unnamed protein product [Onchocerca flexuosa]
MWMWKIPRYKASGIQIDSSCVRGIPHYSFPYSESDSEMRIHLHSLMLDQKQFKNLPHRRKSFCYVRIFSSQIDDPYRVLGISRRATIKEIKQAYKTLAREWHPDKNQKSNAHEKFMAITGAYEILSDPLRKERYDKFGSFDDPPPSRTHTYYSFDDYFSGFGGFDNGNSFFQNYRISMRTFSHTLLERSYFQPFIIFAYSGYCQLCFHLEPIWQSIVNDLEPLGYGIGTINAITDGNLLEKVRISRLPSIVVIVEGRVIHYRGSMQRIN